MSKPKLIYFDVRGRGEMIRLTFAAGGVDFEDSRIHFGGPEWDEMKKSGVAPFGQLPILQIDGKGTLAQSTSLMRYAAKVAKLYPSDDYDATVADMLADAVTDLGAKFYPMVFQQDKAKQEELKKEYYGTTLPQYLDNVQKILKLNGDGRGFFVGNKLSVADICVFTFANDTLAKGKLEVPDELSGYSLLKDHYIRVLNEPKINAYIKARKQTEL